MLSKNVIVLPEFAFSTRVFREVIATSVKVLKKMIVSYALQVLERRKEKKIRAYTLYTCYVTTSITTMIIKV